jgi:hypothetical protein
VRRAGRGVILCFSVIFLDLGDRSYLFWMSRKGGSSSLTELLIFFVALCCASSVIQS